MSFLKSTNHYVSIWLLYAAVLVLVCAFAGCATKNNSNSGSNNKDTKLLALTYLSKGQLNEATAALQKAIQENPNDSSSYILLSQLYLLQKNYDEAESTIIAGLKIKPENEDLSLVLAGVFDKKNNRAGAVQELKKILHLNPESVKAYYKLSQLDTSVSNKKNYLLKVLSIIPANIVVRLQLSELLAGEQKTDSALFYLQSVRKIAPDFSEAAKQSYQQAASTLESNQPLKAIVYLKQFHDLMKLTPEYVSGKYKVEISPLYAGHFQFDTNIRNLLLDTSHVSTEANQTSILDQIKFTDASQNTGLATGNVSGAKYAVLAVSDYDAEGNMFVYASHQVPGSPQVCNLFINTTGAFSKVKVTGGIDHPSQDLCATFADYDNDGYQDLFVGTTNGILVYKNNGDGTFTKIKEDIGLHYAGQVYKILIADFDQDGDLDMYVSGSIGNKFFRNNGDGTFTENGAAMGLDTKSGSLDMDYGDWDSDGDLDIITLNDNGNIQLFNNNRHSNFTDISNAVGFQNLNYSGTALAFGDYNNDGKLDIFMAGGADGKCLLLKNNGGQNFTIDEKASEQISQSLKGIRVYDVTFLDFDNDGHQDILVAGVNQNPSKSGIKLFHNDGAKGFSDVSYLLPQEPIQAYHIGIADFNYDGDEDIFLAGPTGIHLLRNDGGNLNNYVQIHLTGLSFGNNRNNRLGIGGQIELKAGDLYQLKTVKGPLTEFGVGQRRKIDAVRIIWPNGVPETVLDPTRKEKVLEQELLKGSCPYLYTWDGKKYTFLMDMLWRSALGMPLAIKGRDTTFAYSGPSKGYLLIPGEKLKPKDGLYSIKITEELWEAVFVDKIKLMAIDHPDSVNVFADEKFLPPPYPGMKVYQVAHPYLPVTTTDGRGNNLMPKIRAYDFNYVCNFPIGKYQGLVKTHDLILDLGKKADNDKELHLFMRGWVLPTDASINTAFTQSDKYKLAPPSLQVINKEGKWQTVIKNIGYPLGRDKMVIVNLSHKFLTAYDRRVRIVTNMQIYWDHIFFSAGKVNAPLKIYDLKMAKADLDYHGYSATYRKGGPYGPYWPDYYKVTKGQKWRDLTGYYTRYGNVLPLLQKADDEYVICNSGDEISIDFDAKNLPALPSGWTRDFMIYSEGWVKDGDLNTVYGQTVDPLPFHNMPSYPYGKNIHYPTDKAHRDYMKEYNTRNVTTYDFRNAIRLGTFENTSK